MGSSVSRPITFSSRMGRDTPNAIARAERRARAGGRVLRSLNDSNPTRHGLAPDVLPGVYEADPRGPRPAREAVASLLSRRQSGDRVDADHVYLMDSTSQAYAWLFMLLCDRNDAILAPRPGYPLIESLAALTGVRVEPYHLRYDGSWTVDIGDVERRLSGPEGHRIRAIVMINPNNPTGSFIHEPERDAVVALCRRHGVALIADEVFYPYPLEPLPGRCRLAGCGEVLTFALDGLSKSLAAPHAKVGWIEVSGPRGDVDDAMRLLDRIADDFLPMGSCVADRVPQLVESIPEQVGRVSLRTKANLEALKRTLAETPGCLLSLLRPEGGWNVLLRMPATVDEDDVVLTLIRDHGLTGQPGYFFDMPGNGYLALSLLPEPDVFLDGVRAVTGVVNDLASSTT